MVCEVVIAAFNSFSPTRHAGKSKKVDRTMSEDRTPNLTLDVQGVLCPLPVIKAKKSLKSLKIGETLLVLTTDPVALIDIPHMCNQFGHKLVQSQKTDAGHAFLIKKIA